MNQSRNRWMAALTLLLTTSWVSADASGYGYHHGYAAHHGYGYHHGTHLGFHGHAHGELALGLLAGALIGYALINHHRHRRYPSRPSAGPVTRPAPGVASTCLQEREYHTTVIIDGTEVPAWGIACLQPDGTWQRKGMSLRP